MSHLTPAEIVVELDKYIVGQTEAKRAVAIALSTRERRKRVPAEMQREIVPKNIIMIGPTGVGKTEIARRVAALLDAPFIKVEATKFTEVGYVGRDVDSIVTELVETSFMKTYEGRLKEVEPKAEKLANEKLLGYVCQQLVPSERPRRARSKIAAVATVAGADKAAHPASSRRLVAKLLQTKQLDDQMVEIELNEDSDGYGMAGYAMEPEEMGEAFNDFLDDAHSYRTRHRRRRVSVKEARRILTRAEASKLLDINQIVEDSVNQAEQSGVVFIDELDKIVGPKVEMGRDVSGEGVQRDLLPLLEGTTIMTRFGPVKTDYMLYITAGAFYHSKPSDLIAELQGRLPIRVELQALGQAELERILTEPRNALTKQYQALMATEGVEVEFSPEGIKEIARLAALMNERTENIGARRLNTIMEKVMEDLSFYASDRSGQKVIIDPVYIRQRVLKLIKDEDLSRYIL